MAQAVSLRRNPSFYTMILLETLDKNLERYTGCSQVRFCVITNNDYVYECLLDFLLSSLTTYLLLLYFSFVSIYCIKKFNLSDFHIFNYVKSKISQMGKHCRNFCNTKKIIAKRKFFITTASEANN